MINIQQPTTLMMMMMMTVATPPMMLSMLSQPEEPLRINHLTHYLTNQPQDQLPLPMMQLPMLMMMPMLMMTQEPQTTMPTAPTPPEDLTINPSNSTDTYNSNSPSINMTNDWMMTMITMMMTQPSIHLMRAMMPMAMWSKMIQMPMKQTAISNPCPQQHPVPTFASLCLLDVYHHHEKLDNLQGDIQQLYDTVSRLIVVIIDVLKSTLLTLNPAIIKTSTDPHLPPIPDFPCAITPPYVPPAPPNVAQEFSQTHAMCCLITVPAPPFH